MFNENKNIENSSNFLIKLKLGLNPFEIIFREEKKLKHEEVVELLNQGLGNLKTADGIAQFVKVSKLDGEVSVIICKRRVIK